MPKRSQQRPLALILNSFLSIILLSVAVQGQTRVARRGFAPEQRTANFFESLRKSPPQQFAFLRAMPKGADLHNHLSGAIYAESYILWAAKKGLCINTATFVLTQSPCTPDMELTPMTAALTDGVLYRQIIDAWSMRNWQYSGQSGHDRFFDTFSKFAPATYDQTGPMLAEVTARAARGQVLYLELMLTPDGGKSSDIGKKLEWSNDLQVMLDRLKAGGIEEAVTQSLKNLRDAEEQKNEILRCGTAQADPGCGVTVRYIFQVGRGSALSPVYAQMTAGFMLIASSSKPPPGGG